MLLFYDDGTHESREEELPTAVQVAVSRPGDLLGRYRLLQGDARHRSYDRLLHADEQVRVALT
jgi:hypothetical protein